MLYYIKDKNKNTYMLEILITFIVGAVVVYASAMILPGVSVAGFGIALVTAVVLAVINVLIKPIITLLTLPINILTLGLFGLVINALLVMLAGWIVPGFDVANFGWALLFGVVVALFNGVVGLLSEE